MDRPSTNPSLRIKYPLFGIVDLVTLLSSTILTTPHLNLDALTRLFARAHQVTSTRTPTPTLQANAHRESPFFHSKSSQGSLTQIPLLHMP